MAKLRPANCKPLMFDVDPNNIAVACAVALTGNSVPVLDLNDVRGIADFILALTGLQGAVSYGTA